MNRNVRKDGGTKVDITEVYTKKKWSTEIWWFGSEKERDKRQQLDYRNFFSFRFAMMQHGQLCAIARFKRTKVQENRVTNISNTRTRGACKFLIKYMERRGGFGNTAIRPRCWCRFLSIWDGEGDALSEEHPFAWMRAGIVPTPSTICHLPGIFSY